MGTMIINALYTLLVALVNGACSVIGSVLTVVSQYALVEVSQPWVQLCVQVSTAVAAGLFTLRVGYEAVTRYILWNEGIGDQDGGQIWKGVLRTAIYGAAGTWLVYNVFQFGIWYGGALLTTPITVALASTQGLLGQANAITGMTVEILLVFVVGVIALVVCLVVVELQMGVRAAELIFFMVGAPLVALGQMNSDGGIWSSWWRSLVVLSMSQAVQWLGIHIIIGSFTVVTANPVGALGALGGVCISLFLALGAAIATIRGPHLLKEWSYRTGVGAGIMSGAMFAGQTAGREWIRAAMK